MNDDVGKGMDGNLGLGGGKPEWNVSVMKNIREKKFGSKVMKKSDTNQGIIHDILIIIVLLKEECEVEALLV